MEGWNDSKMGMSPETTLCLLLKGISALELCHIVIQSRSVPEVAGQRGEAVSAVVLGEETQNCSPPTHTHTSRKDSSASWELPSQACGRVKKEELLSLRGGGVLISSESRWANPLVQAHQESGKYSSLAWLHLECSVSKTPTPTPHCVFQNEGMEERGRGCSAQGQRWQ